MTEHTTLSGRLREHIRSNVVGYVAVFIALTGVSYAGPLKPNKVKTKHIADAAVTTPKLADSAVTTQKLGADSINAAKVAPDSLGGEDIDESSLQGLSASPTGSAGGDLTGTYPNPDIASGAVGAAELGNNAVVGGTLGDVADDSLTGADLATGSVVGGAGGDVQDNTLSNDDVGPSAIGASELATSAVVGGVDGDVQDDTLTTDDVLNNSLTAADLSNTLGTDFLGSDIDPTEAAATNDFVNLVDGTSSSTEANEDLFNVPIAVLASNLRAEVDAPPGAGNDRWTITLRDDGANTILVCQIDEAATSCSSGATVPVIGAGSRLTVVVNSNDEGAGTPDPNAASSMKVSFALTP